ncbi:hypothetical protein BFN03_13845 [Rhodococcus sp. WMMA185]|uniref:DUF2537 domain-containing protein n=1 Tax=Rhodococcus sp. WMMA185 TaxID=679318 RepID=UPI000877EC07|nr:DUF2537 domain-containing protein [Rhodococcus sp. WMMA185]AOW93368.1 hypothetical protein BFN03_13845 [Rhodococcus sp. WMMA185]
MGHPHAQYQAHSTDQPARTPWFTGLVVAGFSAALVFVAVVAFGSQLARINVVLAVVLEVVAVVGFAPSAWRLRRVPIWRWLVYGAAAGVLGGWFVMLVGAA